MTDSNATLLPCPFCGGEAEPFNPFDNADGTWCVLCSECAAATGFEQTEAEAIAAWNTRHQCGLTDEDYSIMLDELGVSEQTCRIESTNGEWYCSCCGEVVGSDDPWCELFTNENAIRLWNCCPNCGAKVVSA